ncbi:MAG TPA: xanthine dehydrogenase family protein subunit M [Thermohalobaculum sp.]|nr:xanthine dehydrogenase family protein subunit M [Thermohalobaculum sp.]
MRFESPETLDAAVSLLAGETGVAKVLAGGTDLLVQLRSGAPRPELIVDIKRIAETRRIAEEDGGFRIGAAVAGAEMGEHEGLKAAWPGVVEAMELIGSTQIQGRATPGGNLCNGSPAADCVPALVAARATARIVGPDGPRDVAVEDVVEGPGKTILKRGEFVASFFLPSPEKGQADAYLRFIPRTEMDIAVVGCGVCLTVNATGTCTDARVALGAVGPRVIVANQAAEGLIGTPLDDTALDRLKSAASAAAQPIDDKRGTADFRRKVAGVLARRAAAAARDRATSAKEHA